MPRPAPPAAASPVTAGSGTDPTVEPTRPRTSPRVWRAAALVAAAAVLAAAVALAWRPVASAVALERGRAALNRADPHAAADILLAAAEQDPRNPLLAFEAAKAARRDGRFADDPAALDAALTRAARLGADPEAVRRERVLAAAASGRMDGPGGVWTELPGLLQDDRGDLAGICTAYVNGLCVNRDFGRAAKILDEWDAADPDSPEAAFRRGLIELSRQNDEEAEVQFREALAGAPWRADAAVKLAKVLREGVADDPAAAAAVIGPFVESRPDEPEVWEEYGEALRALGRHGGAVPALRRAVELAPDDLDLRRPLAESLLAAGEPAAALEALGPMLAAWPMDRRATFSEAQALRDLGRPAEAREAFARLQQIEEARGPLIDLARATRETGIQASRDLLYRTGMIALKHEDREEGLGYLVAVLRLDPRHGPTHAALARAFAASGREDRARRHRRLAARYGATSAPAGASDAPGPDDDSGSGDGGEPAGGAAAGVPAAAGR